MARGAGEAHQSPRSAIPARVCAARAAGTAPAAAATASSPSAMAAIVEGSQCCRGGVLRCIVVS
jgi:hypothetical protein